MRPDTPLVAAQALTIAGTAWPGRARWALPRAVVVAAVSTGLAGAGLSVAGALPHGSRLTPRVVPPDDAELLTGGVYAVSRHPVYAGLVLATGAFAVLRGRPEPLVSWLGLVAVLDRKTRHEEVHLAERFGAAYERYRRRTPRLLGVPGRPATHDDGRPPRVR
ncbi:isoprenylcysteine carboxylmethyltransferase family protein [Actinotalea sp. AC32]|nr:isoprenylcysteine carboxylmethyltransferase family protein [Actinotalea sp. AC32]